MSGPARSFCRDCAYELTALSVDALCPECGGEARVGSLSKTRVLSPWWVRLWPLYVGELTLLPVLLAVGRNWFQDGFGAVLVGVVFTHGFWMPAFLAVAAIGWSPKFVGVRSHRITAQVVACAALVGFPTLSVMMELVNPTDAQSGLALLVMPAGIISVVIGGAFGALAARVIFR